MSGSRAKSLEQVNRQLNQYRNNLNKSEGNILNQLSRGSSPEGGKQVPSPGRMLSDNRFEQRSASNSKVMDGTSNSESGDDRELVEYIRNMKNLQSALEQKISILQIDSERQKMGLENQISVLGQDLKQAQKRLGDQQSVVKMLSKQLQQGEASSQEKARVVEGLREELAHYRKQGVSIKEENKKYRADNKIIMNQLDRLEKQSVTTEEREKMLKEREIRVMKSLYQDLGSIEDKQKMQKEEHTSDLSNHRKVSEATTTNVELKSLIHRLNQENSLLSHQKQILCQQNKQKAIQLENQKQICCLSEESNEKLNDIIQKMGDKLFNLEEINETLRLSLAKVDGSSSSTSEDSYYRTTQIKAGQFYYKR